MLSALGYVFLDENGNELVPNGENLAKIRSFRDDKVIKEVSKAKFLIACDVDNPFYGPNGAACVYGKQKGATKEIIKILDNGMKNFSDVIKEIIESRSW